MKKQNFILFFALLAIVGLFAASPAFAQAGASQGPCSSTDKLGECIVRIYRWSLGLAVLLALIMIIFAGYKYITAGGNAQSVASAKEMFAGAFIGLIILFAAVIILRTINPNLVLFNGNFWASAGDDQVVVYNPPANITPPPPPPPPPARVSITSFTASPASITAGGSSTLSWQTSNATNVSISSGIGTVTSNGSLSVSPGITTTYVLTASDAIGSFTSSVQITVGAPPDTTPPSTPANLSATGVSASLVQLTWNMSTDNVGVVGYRIYRSGTEIGISTTPSYSDTSVAPSFNYSYTVAAYDAAGNLSGQSNVATASTPAQSFPPPPVNTPPLSTLPPGTHVSTVIGGPITNSNTCDQTLMNATIAMLGTRNPAEPPYSLSCQTINRVFLGQIDYLDPATGTCFHSDWNGTTPIACMGIFPPIAGGSANFPSPYDKNFNFVAANAHCYYTIGDSVPGMYGQTHEVICGFTRSSTAVVIGTQAGTNITSCDTGLLAATQSMLGSRNPSDPPYSLSCITVGRVFVGKLDYMLTNGLCYHSDWNGTNQIPCKSTYPLAPGDHIPSPFDSNFNWSAANGTCYYTIGDLVPGMYGQTHEVVCGYGDGA